MVTHGQDAIEANSADVIPLTRFMMFDGKEKVLEALGIKFYSFSYRAYIQFRMRYIDLGAIDDMNDIMDENESVLLALKTLGTCVKEIQSIETAALNELIQRHQMENDTGISDEFIVQNKDLFKMIEAGMKKKNTSTAGYIMWLNRGSSIEPDIMDRRPNILPNPELWNRIISSKASSESDTLRGSKINNDEDDEINRVDEVGKVVHHRSSGSRDVIGLETMGHQEQSGKAKISQALARLAAFNRGASEMAKTADMVLNYSTDFVARSKDKNAEIVEATNHFKNAILTQKEIDWYESIRSVEKIKNKVQTTVDQARAKPWKLLQLPEIDEATIARSKEAKEMQNKRRQAVHEALSKLLIRKGEENLDPRQELLARDGLANPRAELADMSSTNFESMTKELLIEHCKHRKLSGKSAS